MVSAKDDRLSRLRKFVSDLEGIDSQLGIEPKFRAHIDIFAALRQSGETWPSIAGALIRLGVEHPRGSNGLAATLKTYWNRNRNFTTDVSVPAIAVAERPKVSGKPPRKVTERRSTLSQKIEIGADQERQALPSAQREIPNAVSKRPTSRFDEIRKLRKATKTSFDE